MITRSGILAVVAKLFFIVIAALPVRGKPSSSSLRASLGAWQSSELIIRLNTVAFAVELLALLR